MSKETASEEIVRAQLCEFLTLFYEKGWVAGTGGGICAGLDADRFLMAPTGVHKERVQPDDLFIVDRRGGGVLQPPKNTTLRLSECATIFCLLINQRGAGSVMHSHGLSSVLAADLADGAGEADRIVFKNLEMLKGIRGVSNLDRHAVPVIRNTPREPELVGQIKTAIEDPDFARAHCILVRDHGAYIWGADLWETKRHAEVYHFLFEATVARGHHRADKK
ncbi:MAG: methylthioribulose 1-phosphate dehydratase [Nitrospirae bacterium]|nr:methylthioribulose 1-phosphate dehydratase [Candidatus Manganitrophaceae bacterium]